MAKSANYKTSRYANIPSSVYVLSALSNYEPCRYILLSNKFSLMFFP
jgi:hypothetical protein